MSSQGSSLKDQLYNRDKIRYLADLFAGHAVGFDAHAFEADVMASLLDLELKERIHMIARMLEQHVPGRLPQVAPILRAALPAPLDPTRSDDDFGDFIFAPLGEWVVNIGLEDHCDLSLDLLAEITQRFSMEWAIRPFLNRWPQETLARMQVWALNENYHVRRLASEGTRPRLPWGTAVGLELSEPLPILDQLHGDKTRYVTRSVANHLNDITKKDPDLVLTTLKRWHAQGLQTAKELDWMTSHALRGLVKAGHSGAMALLGYDPDLEVDVALTLPDTVRINEKLVFTCDLVGAKGAAVLVDYRMTFQRPGGKTSRKVFKLKQSKLGNAALQLSKTHPLKGGAATFTLVPGTHQLEVLVNGRARASAAFELLA